jgi:hypothetical protein
MKHIERADLLIASFVSAVLGSITATTAMELLF